MDFFKDKIDSIVTFDCKGRKSNLAKLLGTSASTIANYIEGRSKAKLEIVLTILNVFPDISADWLLRNEGDKYRNRTTALEQIYRANNQNREQLIDTSVLDERLRAIEKKQILMEQRLVELEGDKL